MLAVHLENGAVTMRQEATPHRPPGFALLRLIAGGICNTDLELQRGYYGFSGIPGHEFVAEVMEADNASLVGERVVGEINLNCGHCGWCRKDMGRHCPNRTVLGIVKHPGAFQEFFTLPERNLHVLPDGMPTERALFTEPLAAACEILEQVTIPPHEPIAVLGDGKLGLLISQVLDVYGYHVHQFGRHKEKLRIAEKAGVCVQVVTDALPVAEYGWVVDATGSPEGLRSAAAMAWPRGTVILKSTVHSAVPVDTAPIVVNELTLIGSRCGRFDRAILLLDHGLINVGDMISDRFPLSAAPEAFKRAAEPGVLKVLLE